VPNADRGRDTFLTIVDRTEAIDCAIKMAQPGDLVLLAGKGHEKTQVIGTLELPFDEGEIAREALQRRRSRSRAQ
jgi:UDP-N-acetylmuramoyl-L-alanyl-D-glutamate--2,6-diaminopimelate ligase